ncbi:hypothetical protein KY314_01355 [Candidatus Woesearchaeota archaeon]|nr:hypothetical protein [Candidatus Woesearchaeota archaeon]
MDNKKIMLAVVVLIAISATISMIEQRNTGQITHHQTIHKNYMVYRQTYDPCTSVRCTLNADAVQIGNDLAGNTVCQCPDGQRFIVDTWREY